MERENSSPKRAGRVGSVEHAIEILRIISDAQNPVGVNEISRKMGLHKSSISRIVSTLNDANILEKDNTTGKYCIGVGLIALAAPVHAKLSLNDIVKSVVAEVVGACNETCSFNIWDGECGVSIINIQGKSTIQVYSSPGRRKPGHATATGKALLAYQSPAVIEHFCSLPQARFTEATITGQARLVKELRTTKSRGYATNFGEFEKDVGAVAAPVLSSEGQLIGCISVTVPIFRLSEERSHELGLILMNYGTKIAKSLLLGGMDSLSQK